MSIENILDDRKRVVYGVVLAILIVSLLIYGWSFLFSLGSGDDHDTQGKIAIFSDGVNHTNDTYSAEIAFTGSGGAQETELPRFRVVAYSESCAVLTEYYLPDVHRADDLQSQSDITLYAEKQPAYIVVQSSAIGNLSDETVTWWTVENLVIRDNGSAERYEIEVYEADGMRYRPFPTEEQLNDTYLNSAGSEECPTGAE